MTFLSAEFYCILFIALITYYILPQKVRCYVFLLFNIVIYFFIANKDLKCFAMLILTALVGYAGALIISKLQEDFKKKFSLAFFIFIVFMPLILIKNLNPFLSFINKGSVSLIVPIGVSFYTLQLISYMADVYRGKYDAQRNFLKFFIYISFFPIIIQGPISRYDQLASQLYEGHDFEEKKITEGFMLILWGFFLKLVIADKAAIVVNNVFDSFPVWQGSYVLVAGLLYPIQLYADFQGCTLIAQGVACMFGIKLINNFNHPYFSKSMREFWERWHISLSTWLRDYVYIPLGGSRKGKVRKWMNLFITFLVSAAWHGSGLKYVVWGLMTSFIQLVEAGLDPVWVKVGKKYDFSSYSKLINFIRCVVTYFLFILTVIIFRADTLEIGCGMLKSLFTVNNAWVWFNDGLLLLGLNLKEYFVLLISIGILLFVSFKQEKGFSFREFIFDQNIVIRWFFYIGTVLVIMVFGTYGFGFDAQAFIYGGF